MGKRSDNISKLKALGILLDPSGHATVLDLPASDPLPAPSPDDVQDPTPTDPPPSPDPTPSTPEPTPQDRHNWEKRRQDAQDAQRALSLERTKLEEVKRDLDLKLQELADRQLQLQALADRVQTAQPPPAHATPAPEGDPLSDYPELAQAIDLRSESKIAPLKVKLQETIDRIEREDKARKEEEAKARSKKVIEEILAQEPKAIDIAQSEAFAKWIASLPPKLGAEYDEIMEHTSRYSANDALYVIREFKKTQAPQGKPPMMAPTRDTAPTLPPGPSGVNGSAPNRAVTPLSQQELDQIDVLMRRAGTPENRSLLRDRLALTLSSIR